MVELEIDGDFVSWAGLFLTNQKVQLFIDRHNNKEREIEAEIPQSSSVSPILFLIYISRVFNDVLETSLLITSIFFIDDLGFIVSGSLVKKVVKDLEKVAQEVIERGSKVQ